MYAMEMPESDRPVAEPHPSNSVQASTVLTETGSGHSGLGGATAAATPERGEVLHECLLYGTIAAKRVTHGVFRLN